MLSVVTRLANIHIAPFRHWLLSIQTTEYAVRRKIAKLSILCFLGMPHQHGRDLRQKIGGEGEGSVIIRALWVGQSRANWIFGMIIIKRAKEVQSYGFKAKTPTITAKIWKSYTRDQFFLLPTNWPILMYE